RRPSRAGLRLAVPAASGMPGLKKTETHSYLFSKQKQGVIAAFRQVECDNPTLDTPPNSITPSPGDPP
ncbi:hypothetical protein, partial [Burkholderia glumae]|uniref:hypothetical protein n=1 Tax=Burkholderia glumae TaxID=337 RepID=UPI0019D714B5